MSGLARPQRLCLRGVQAARLSADGKGMTRPVYTYLPGAEVTEQQIKDCARLFSEHYGVWGEQPGSSSNPKPGSRVRLSAERLRAQYLFNTETCDLVVAKIGDELIGHVFVTKFEYPGHGSVCWITQVVVSASHRSHGIGSRLCRIAWSSCTNDFACGLVSSHPHAVRALECATERLCDLDAITEHAAGLIEASDIPYMQNRRVVQHTVDTQFYVDHTEVNQLIKKQVNWTLGELADGHEFFAFTFMSSPRRRGSGSGSLTGSPPKHTKVSSQE